MPARYSRFFRSIHITGDVIILNFSFLLGNAIYFNDLYVSFTDTYIKQFLYINLFWAVASSAFKVYDLHRVMRTEVVLSTLFKAFILHNLFVLTFIEVFNQPLHSYKSYTLKYGLFIFNITAWRVAFLLLLQLIRSKGLNYRRVVVVGAGLVGEAMFRFFVRHPEHGYRFLGFFDDRMTHDRVLGNVEDVKRYCSENDVDEMYCALPDVDNDQVHDLMRFADNNLIRFKMLPDFRGFDNKRVEINFYDKIPVLMVRKEPLENLTNRFVKRTFDIIFSLLVILLIFPWFIPMVAVLIKLSSKGPLFFKQLRSGKDNRTFVCYKLRTMKVNNLADQLQATRTDPRITAIGKFLRKTSLDELPQFFNVLIGNMSVVGPRPHMLRHTEEYSQVIDRFMVRHFVKPGISGLAQVSGYRGETSDPLLMQKRVELDVWYLENWSLLLDIKIILLTVWNILTGDKNAG